MNSNTTLHPSTPCNEALAIWFDQHRTYIRGGTVRTYRQYVATVSNFFGSKPLAEIGVTEVRAYQAWRSQTCVATRVNAELSALQMCMKEADLWEPVAKLYRPLPVPKTKVRQNMSEEEERRFLRVALDPKMTRRLLAGHCLIVMANTSMGFGELRHLRRQDVFLIDDPPFVEVNGGNKNDYRLRSIPLNFLALRSMRWIVKRWEDLGGSDPEHFILPHHRSSLISPHVARKSAERSQSRNQCTRTDHAPRRAVGGELRIRISHSKRRNSRSRTFSRHASKNLSSRTRKMIPELEVAEMAFAIMRNVGVGPSELRRTRLRDVDLESTPPTYHVAGDATHFDVVPRLIPLNTEAQTAFQRAIERANKLGARLSRAIRSPTSA